MESPAAIYSLAVRRWSDASAKLECRVAGLLPSYAHDRARRLSEQHPSYAWMVRQGDEFVATYVNGVRQSDPNALD